MTTSRTLSLVRMLATMALAYALAAQGLLGAMGAGAQAGVARLAAQLGVICTVHGIVDPSTGKAGGDDPTPGKLACIQHCVLLLGQQLASPPDRTQPLSLALAPATDVTTPLSAADAQAYPSAAPPPPRGPPAS